MGGFNAGVFVLSGAVLVNRDREVGEAELSVHEPQGSQVHLAAQRDSRLLILSGEPIRDPVARMGPFVMNTQEELVQAVSDYRAGKMGHLVDH